MHDGRCHHLGCICPSWCMCIDTGLYDFVRVVAKGADSHCIHLERYLARRSDVGLDDACSAYVTHGFIMPIARTYNPVRIELMVQLKSGRNAVMPRNAEGGIALPIFVEVADLVHNDHGYLELIGDALQSLCNLEDGIDPGDG